MKRSRFTTEQIVAILDETNAGMPVKDLLRKHGAKTRHPAKTSVETTPRDQVDS